MLSQRAKLQVECPIAVVRVSKGGAGAVLRRLRQRHGFFVRSTSPVEQMTCLLEKQHNIRLKEELDHKRLGKQQVSSLSINRADRQAVLWSLFSSARKLALLWVRGRVMYIMSDQLSHT